MSSGPRNGNIDQRRTKQVETRTEQAETRAEQAKTKTAQAQLQTEQAGTRLEQADTRTEQTQTRAEQARTQTAQALIQTRQAGTDLEQAGTRLEQTETRAEQARTQTAQVQMQTKQAGTHLEQIETRMEQRETRAEQARTQTAQALMQTEQAGTHLEQAQTRTQQARTQTEQEIVARRLAAIIESSDDAIIGKDLQSIITNWNPGAEKIFGYTAGEMLGTSIMRLIPADRHEEENHLLGKLRRGESVEHFETLRQTKDGRLINVSVTVSPIKDATGRVVGVSKVARNITERIQSEESRRASEGRYRTLFEKAPDGILIADAESRYLDANPSICRMLGYTREELIGLHASDIVAQKEVGHIEPALTAIKAGPGYHREWQFRRKDGSFFDAEVIATTMPDGNLLGMIRDISERKAAEEKIRQMNAELERRVAERTAQLEAANKELEAFSYSVSHDLRAPLRAINGFADIVLTDFGPQLNEVGQRHLKRIRDGGQQMGELIDDLLAFSRLGRQPMGRQIVDSAKLVQTVLGESAPQRDGRQIELNIGALPACSGDPALLKQVWVNLISNAIKYTRGRAPAVIEIGCVRENNENIFFVRDNGTGFDMRYAGKLFGVFQRLHRADEFEGTGVGLAIVQRIVHRHGGRVWAEAAEGRGATFHFTLEGKNNHE